MLTPLAKAAEVVITQIMEILALNSFTLSPSNLQAMLHNPPAKKELGSLLIEKVNYSMNFIEATLWSRPSIY